MRLPPGKRSKSGRILRPGCDFFILASLSLALLSGCSSPQSSAELPPLMPSVAAPPQPPEPLPAPPAPAKPPPKFSAHVASYKTLPEAEAAWPQLVQRFPSVKGEPRHYVEVDLGDQRGKVIRLLLGAFAARGDATEYCHRLRSAGMYCAAHNLPVSDIAKSGS